MERHSLHSLKLCGNCGEITVFFVVNQALISAHMRKLLSLNSILNISDVKALQTLYDTVKMKVGWLDYFGQDYANNMFIPAFLTKLPFELYLKISRKCGKAFWDIREVVDVINLGNEARENVVVHEEKSKSDRMFSGSAVFSASNQSKIRKCLFCNQQNHKSHQCKKFQNRKFEKVSSLPWHWRDI